MDLLGSRCTPSAFAAVACFVLAIWTLSLLRFEHVLHAAQFAANPRRVADGKLWYLLTSALIATHPVFLSLASFALFALGALVVCGPRIFWASTLVGHVAATVMTYLLLGLARAVEPTAYAGLVTQLDYGVSTMQATWLGAVAATLWLTQAQTVPRRASIAAGCAAIGLIAYLARPDLTLLDTDHGFAFLIGITLVATTIHATSRGRLLDPSSLPMSRRPTPE